MKTPLLLLAFIVAILLPQTITAQQYGFRSYSLEQGLTQSEVNTITQDKNGFIWVGTNGGGICRFDGQKFIALTREDGLIYNQVSSMITDSKGNLWIGTTRNGLSMYDGKHFTNYSAKDSILTDGGYKIREDQQGRLWILTPYRNTSRLCIRQDGKFINISSQHELLRDNPVSDLVCDREGNIVLSTSKGLLKAVDGQLTPFSVAQPEVLEGKTVTLYLHDSRNRLWMSIGSPSRSARLAYYDGKSFTFVEVPSDVPVAQFFQAVEDHKGHLWFRSQRKGIFRFNGTTFTHFTSRNGLYSNDVLSMMVDKDGIVWLGNGGGGLIRFEGDKFVRFTEKDGLNNNIIWAVYHDEPYTWFGTGTGGIYRFDGNQMHQFNAGQELQLGRIKSFFKAKDGSFYVTTLDGGILKLAGNTFKPCWSMLRLNEPPITSFTTICQDNRDRLWIGSPKGIIIFDGKTSTRLTTENGLPHNYVSQVVQDKQGQYWILTVAGISRYDGKKFTHYSFQGETTPLRPVQMALDRAGNLWTVGFGGIARFDGNRFVTLTAGETGINSLVIYSLLTDHEGNLWAGGQTSLYKIMLSKQGEITQVKEYGREEGFHGSESNAAARFADKNRNLWFGTIGGAVRYTPAEDVPHPAPPAVYITNLKLFLKDINWEDSTWHSASSGMSAWTHLPDQLVLPHDQNHLTFELAALSYHNPEKVRFQWKLEGLDRDWIPVTDKKEAVYSNIPHGTYTFKVRACNSDGIWNDTATSYRFTIAPPFWQTWWFRSVIGIAMISLAFTGVKMRLRRVESQKYRLECLVEERTAEVVKQRDEIIRKSEELQKQKEEIQAQSDQIIQQHELILEKNYELQFQTLELEKKSKAITSSLNYAQRIQEAILPMEKTIRDALPESFILFRPREAVSGDFYWMAEADGKLIIAAVDCTGHGVPGAFMSMVGYNLLNEIVHHRHVTAPHQILAHLHEGIVRVLKQHETRNRDGMDLAICTIDPAAQTLTYAGALNPLVIVRDGEMELIKGDKLPTGGWQLEQNRVFTPHVISYRDKPATFYMYTDGYQDQFNDTKRQKLTSRHFRNLLLDVSVRPIDEQKQLLWSYFDQWKGEYYQVDDVLVVGFKLG